MTADRAKVAGTCGSYADRVKLTPNDLRHKLDRHNTEKIESDGGECSSHSHEQVETGTQTVDEVTVVGEIFIQLAEMWKRLARLTDLIRQIPKGIKEKVLAQVKNNHEEKYANWVGSIIQV